MEDQDIFSSINNIISEHVETFIGKISSKFKLDKDELLELWNNIGKGGKDKLDKKSGKKTEKKAVNKKGNSDSEDSDGGSDNESEQSDDEKDEKGGSREKLESKTVAVLKEMCREKSLPVTGKKSELIDRLTGKTKSPPKKEKPSKGEAIIKSEGVVQQLLTERKQVCVRKNKHGLYVHPPTGFVFEPSKNGEKSTVIGHTKDEKTVEELSHSDIETCKELGFNYKIPDNIRIDEDDKSPDITVNDDEEEDNDNDSDSDNKKSPGKNKDKDQEKGKGKEKSKEKGKGKEKEKSPGKGKEKSKEKEQEKDQEKTKEKEKDDDDEDDDDDIGIIIDSEEEEESDQE